MTKIEDATGRRSEGRAAHVAATAGVLCGAAWYVKLAISAATDGAESGIVATCWALGMLNLFVAAAAAVFARLAGQHVAVRALAGVVAVPIAFTLVNVADAIAKSIYGGDGWFRGEVALLVIGAIAAMLGLVVLVRDQQHAD
jgi:exosortase/archaeosortase